MRSSNRCSLLTSPLNARRALPAAARALSGSPKTIYERTSRSQSCGSEPSRCRRSASRAPINNSHTKTPHPIWRIRAVPLQTLGKPRHHAADHAAALIRIKLGSSSDLLVRRTARRACAGLDAFERSAHEICPRRIRRCVSEQALPHFSSLLSVIILLRREPDEVSCLDLSGIGSQCPVECRLGFLGHDSICSKHKGLAQGSLAFCIRTVEAQRIAPRCHRILETAQPHVNRRYQLPTTTIIGCFSEMLFHLRDEAVDRLTAARCNDPGTQGLVRKAGRPQCKVGPRSTDRQQGQDSRCDHAAPPCHRPAWSDCADVHRIRCSNETAGNLNLGSCCLFLPDGLRCSIAANLFELIAIDGKIVRTLRLPRLSRERPHDGKHRPNCHERKREPECHEPELIGATRCVRRRRLAAE